MTYDELEKVRADHLRCMVAEGWVRPRCHRAQSTKVTWPELADIIDGGTLETMCELCGQPVELSGTEVV